MHRIAMHSNRGEKSNLHLEGGTLTRLRHMDIPWDKQERQSNICATARPSPVHRAHLSAHYPGHLHLGGQPRASLATASARLLQGSQTTPRSPAAADLVTS